MVISAQMRSVDAVGAVDWYEDELQTVSREHTFGVLSVAKELM